MKNWLIWKDSDAGKDWRLEKKGITGDKMVGWHHWLHGHESEQAPGVGNGQGGLECCSLWGRKESDTTEWLNFWKMRLFKDETLLYYYCHYIHFVDGKTESWKGKMVWKVFCKLPITPCMSLSQLKVPTPHWPAASRILALGKMQGGWSALRKAQCTQVIHPSSPCSPGVLNNHRQPSKKHSSQRLSEYSIREGHYIALQSWWRWVRRKEGKIGKLNRSQVLTLPGIEKWLQTHSRGMRAEFPSKRMLFSR